MPRKTVIVEFENDKKQKRSRRSNRIVHGSRPRDYSPRRLQGDVLVNFVDLGQKWDGAAWRDIGWQAIPNFINPNPSGFMGASFDDMSHADFDAMRDLILATPFADWETRFRPLTYDEAEKYGLDIYIGRNYEAFDASKYLPVARPGSRHWIFDDPRITTPRPVNNPRWTTDGLKIPRGTSNFQIWSHGSFCSRKTLNNQYRFTTGPNYTDPFVNFKFDKDCKIFLFPCPLTEWGLYFPGDFNNRANLLNSIFTTVPREKFLGRDFTFTGNLGGASYTGTVFEYQGTLNGFNNDHHMQTLAFTDPFENELFSFMKARTGARVFKLNSFTANTVGALSDFPSNAFGNWGGYSNSVDGGANYFNTFTGFPKVFNGSLIAMIKKGTDWFYVWQDGGTYAPDHYHNFNFT